MPFTSCRSAPLCGLLLLPFANGAASAQTAIDLPVIAVSASSPIQPSPGTPLLVSLDAARTLIVADRTFSPVTIVTRDEFERSTAKTLGDALFTKPGITASTFAPGAASRPIIRGLDNFRVRIQENGIGAHDVSALGEDHGVPIDPLSAETVEVIRGPATLRYGSQAIGGVVSATNNRIPDRIPEGGITARTTGGVSSVDRGYETSSTVDAGSGHAAIHADFFKQYGRDYRIPGGVQANSAFDSKGAAIGGSYLFESGYVGIAFSNFQSLYHVPGGEAAETRTRIDLNQDKVVAKGEWRPSTDAIEAVRFWLGASQYKHDEIGVNEDGLDGIRATFKNREQEARIEIQHRPVATSFGPLSGALGFQFGHRNIGTSGEAGSLLAPAETKNFATYLFEELKLSDSLKLQAAGRIEHSRIEGMPAYFPSEDLPGVDDPLEARRTRNLMPMSASLGLLKDLPYGIVASLNGQYVERSPESPELYSRGAHDAPGTFEIGDPGLKKEAAKTIELGFRRALGDFRFDATAYYTKYSGFIYKRLTGIRCGEEFASCGVEDDFAQIVYSQRDATFYGAEIASQLDLLPLGNGLFGIDGQYDIVNATFSDGTHVPRIPPQRLGGGVFWRDGYWFARIGLLHAFEQNDIGENETPTKGYNLLKAEISYTEKLKARRFGASEITFGVSGNNLLNERIRNHVSFKKDEILLPGRNVRVFATVKF